MPALLLRWLPVWAGMAGAAFAVQITGYSPEAHDRFASGFPANPVRNTSEQFVGSGYDWTGFGWMAGNTRAGFAFVSPRHHLLAAHFGNSGERRLHGNDDAIHSHAHLQSVNLGLGALLEPGPDLAISRLATPVSPAAGMPRYPVLDLNGSSTSNTTTNYLTRQVFICGHRGYNGGTGPRIATASIIMATASGNNHSFQTSRAEVQLEGNDSGSPAYLVWTNPEGEQELAVVGNHAAINETNNIHNFTGSHQVMAALNQMMVPDGHALRVVGEPTNVWQGQTHISIGNRNSWGLSPPASAPTDRFVTFDGSTAGNDREVAVTSNHNLRGMYFRATGGGTSGFHFTGGSTLTIGRGGVVNFDASGQLIEASVMLGDHQCWDAGPGGIVVHDVATNGRLLNLLGSGTTTVQGRVSGGGGIALEGGTLQLPADATYTGKTWIHHGTLHVDGDIRTSAELVCGGEATITGRGMLPQVTGGGWFVPQGILTADSVAPAAEGAFVFRFISAVPDYGNPAAPGNDVLRLTGSPPLPVALTPAHTATILLEAPPGDAAATMRGAFFFDDAGAADALVASATWQVLVADPEGEIESHGQSYTPLAREWTVSMVDETAVFVDGAVSGRVVRLEIAEATGTYEAWAAQVFPEGTPEADLAPDAAPFGDGVANLLAYALALDPLADKTSKLPVGGFADGAIVYQHRMNNHAGDITITVESSADLVDWVPAAAAGDTLDPDVDGDGSASLVETIVPQNPGEMRRFVRLRVVRIDAP